MILPKTKLGKWSIGLLLAFFLFIILFYGIIAFGYRGGELFFDNLPLAITIILAELSALSSFVVGIMAVFKKERGILVSFTIGISFLISVYFLLELLFPH